MLHFSRICVKQALGYLDKCRQTFAAKQAKGQLLAQIESRFVRLKMAAKLNGLNDYELSAIAIPKLKKEIGKDADDSQWWKFRGILFSLAYVLFAFSILMSIFMVCTPCQRLSRMYGRKLLFQVRPLNMLHLNVF